MESRTPSNGGASGGASRTFQSLFGERDEQKQSRSVATDPSCLSREDQDDDDDVWDDDFPSDVNMESAEEDDAGHLKSAEHRQSMSEWADNDDDEDGWKDALQARVDQLELVVEKKAESTQLLNPPHQNETLLPPPVVSTTGTYAPPVDQRATLTLVPKTNLLRSISAPPAVEEPKPASKLKAPQLIRSPRSNTGADGGKPKSNAMTNSSGLKEPGVGATGTGEQARKRSNSRDFVNRTALTKDQKRLTKATPTVASNSVFVRAVVARGNSAGGRTGDTRITNEGHVDKRAKPDARTATLTLSDAEAVRRHILNDVKKISVERIVADAKRLQFLEDLHRRQPDTSQHTSARGGASSTPSMNHAG